MTKYTLPITNAFFLSFFQLDDVNGQLHAEMDNKNVMERETRKLQMELNSLRSMEKTYAKLERAKRKVEDEFNAYKVIKLLPHCRICTYKNTEMYTFLHEINYFLVYNLPVLIHIAITQV